MTKYEALELGIFCRESERHYRAEPLFALEPLQ